MDISSLLSSSVPSYFVLGPLVILLIGLVVMAAHKASPSAGIVQAVMPPVAQVTPQVSVQVPPAPTYIPPHPIQNPSVTQIPVTQIASVNTAPLQPVVPPVAVASVPITVVAAALDTPPVQVVETVVTPPTEPTPPLVPQEVVQAQVVPRQDIVPPTHMSAPPMPESLASVPPISSWKPLATTTPQPALVSTTSEKDMQEAATLKEAQAPQSGTQVA